MIRAGIDNDEDFDFDCIVCFDSFSSVGDAHIPMMLVECGHNVCSSCLVVLPKKACPMCRSPIIFKAMPNRLVVTLLENRNKLQKDFVIRAQLHLEAEERLNGLLNNKERDNVNLKTALRTIAHKRADLETELREANRKVAELESTLAARIEKEERISKMENNLFAIGKKAVEHYTVKNPYPGCASVRDGNMAVISMNYVLY